jgi:hypothetical protein
MEDLVLCVAAIDDVVANSSNRGARRPWHTAILPGQNSHGKKKVECPLFPS